VEQPVTPSGGLSFTAALIGFFGARLVNMCCVYSTLGVALFSLVPTAFALIHVTQKDTGAALVDDDKDFALLLGTIWAGMQCAQAALASGYTWCNEKPDVYDGDKLESLPFNGPNRRYSDNNGINNRFVSKEEKKRTSARSDLYQKYPHLLDKKAAADERDLRRLEQDGTGSKCAVQ
jgi:hypothetical protein